MTQFSKSKADELDNDYSNVDTVSFSSVGRLQLPSYTTAARDLLTAVAGDLIYNSTTDKLNFYTGSAWEAVTSS